VAFKFERVTPIEATYWFCRGMGEPIFLNQPVKFSLIQNEKAIFGPIFAN